MEKQIIKGAAASLTLGICSAILCLLSLTPFTYTLLGIPAIICGIIAIVKSVKAKHSGRSGAATAGLICGIVGIVIGSLAFLGGTCMCGFSQFNNGEVHRFYQDREYNDSYDDPYTDNDDAYDEDTGVDL